MDRGPWTSSELEQMGGWQRVDGKDVIAWPDDEKASDPVAADVEDSVRRSTRFQLRLERRHPGRKPGRGLPARRLRVPAQERGAGRKRPDQSTRTGRLLRQAAADEQGGYEAEPEEEPEQEPAEEPMNRGLLLKFLSSVRN